MNGVYEEVMRILESGEQVAVATLMARRGSAPGSLGAKMLVRRDGGTAGSIGGGCVEAEVWDAARAAMDSGEVGVLAYRLNTEEMAESGLICGGNVEILVEPLDASHLPVIQRIVEAERTRRPVLVATTVPAVEPPGGVGGTGGAGMSEADDTGAGAAGVRAGRFKVLLTAEGEVVGPGSESAPIEEFRDQWRRLPPAATRLMAREGAVGAPRVLLESVAPAATLVIFGGGHLSGEITPLAKRVHFHVTVVDDRPIFANRDRFPEADEVLMSEFEDAFERLAIDDNTFVVIVTRGHMHDRLCLEKSLATDAAYIGMIGSKAKIKKTYDALVEAGVERERLERVHSPIGLFIHARLPEEIAVSIVAELIEERNRRLFG